MHITHSDIETLKELLRVNSTIESWRDSAYQTTIVLMRDMLTGKYGNRDNEAELYLTPYQIQYIVVNAMFEISTIPKAISRTQTYKEFVDIFTTFIGTYIKTTLLELPELTALDLDYTAFKTLFND